MGTHRMKAPKERMKNSFLIAQPFTWNYKQNEIIDRMLDPATSCVMVDSLAGTGKTIMATYAALSALQSGLCRKIYYVRSPVEASTSKLQALPGTWEEKIAVYGGPLMDSLSKLLSPFEVDAFVRNKIIEVIPTAYLRGRSLNNVVVIVDEAQNNYFSELITIMTRLEQNTKLYIIADSDQCDLPRGAQFEFSKIVGLFDNAESNRHGIYYYELRDPEFVMRSRFVKYVAKRYSDYRKLISS